MCASAVIELLNKSNALPGKLWYKCDIVHAHKLGMCSMVNASQAGYKEKLCPMILKMANWGDKIDIFTKGKDLLREMGLIIPS